MKNKLKAKQDENQEKKSKNQSKMRETESEAKGKIKCIGFIMRSEEKREGKRREEKEERGPTLKGVLRKKWPCLGIFSVW